MVTMVKRVAILDIGTNTFHLLIADIRKDYTPEIVFQETIPVKLGEGGISNGYITDEAIERGIKALMKYKICIDKYHPDLIKSAATAAIRSSSNGKAFIEKVKKETGIELEIIDGDQEAEFIYEGVRAAVKMDQTSLIIDIGGGSVELIICDKTKIFWKKSYPIGAARLMDKFHHSNPISKKEIEDLYQYLDQSLVDLKEQLIIYKPELMIGSAGAFESFAKLQDAEFEPTFEKHEFILNIEKFHNITNILTASTHEQRLRMPQIIAVRVDMIVVASLLTKHVLEISGANTLKVSAYSLKEGILFGLAK
jgi:exopolyphosphatase/guanosine-5'-triphosphate,3'-diphosphate pyrophosphatase